MHPTHPPSHATPAAAGRRAHHRRGIALLWVLIAGPAALTMLIVVTDTANLWSARTEYRDGLEASALAAAKAWAAAVTRAAESGDPDAQPDDTAAINAATAVAAANAVSGLPIDATSDRITIQLGWYDDSTGQFKTGKTPPDPESDPAARVAGKIAVNSLYGAFLTTVFGPYDLEASALATIQRDGENLHVVAE